MNIYHKRDEEDNINNGEFFDMSIKLIEGKLEIKIEDESIPIAHSFKRAETKSKTINNKDDYEKEI